MELLQANGELGEAGTKACTDCKETKVKETEFSKKPGSPDGFCYRCKKCHRKEYNPKYHQEINKARPERNRSKVVARARNEKPPAQIQTPVRPPHQAFAGRKNSKDSEEAGPWIPPPRCPCSGGATPPMESWCSDANPCKSCNDLVSMYQKCIETQPSASLHALAKAHQDAVGFEPTSFVEGEAESVLVLSCMPVVDVRKSVEEKRLVARKLSEMATGRCLMESMDSLVPRLPFRDRVFDDHNGLLETLSASFKNWRRGLPFGFFLSFNRRSG